MAPTKESGSTTLDKALRENEGVMTRRRLRLRALRG